MQGPEVDPIAVGRRIRTLRQERHWTMEQLAKEADISKGYLSAVENGKQQVAGAILLRIGKALGASVDFLLTGEGGEPEAPVSLEVPGELAELARENGWSADKMFQLLKAQRSVLARRSDRVRRPFTKHEWKEFADRLRPYMEED